jgi:SOS response associated peptidase (SRAP)
VADSDSGLFAFAGLWTARKDGESGDWLRSCTIITTRPNELVAALHDRMPVILPRELEAEWLDPDISVAHAHLTARALPGRAHDEPAGLAAGELSSERRAGTPSRSGRADVALAVRSAAGWTGFDDA